MRVQIPIKTFPGQYRRLWREAGEVFYYNWLPGKAEWVDHTFSHFCAMLILRGSGEIRYGESVWRPEPPFVFLAKPGERYAYGPDQDWDEVGFIFSKEPQPESLRDWPLEPWRVRSFELVTQHLATIERLMAHLSVPGVVDQVDLLAQGCLLASRYGTGADLPEGPVRRLHEAEAWLRVHFAEPFRLPQLAERFGFSEASFRRLWAEHFPRSPWQHVLSMRVAEAVRLLESERDLQVKEVAYRCGFSDPRAFATVFRKWTGKTPSGCQRPVGSKERE